MDLEGRASEAMARWGPQVRPNPGSSTRLGHEEGAPVSEAVYVELLSLTSGIVLLTAVMVVWRR